MVSGLEGRISELIRINGELSMKSGEQIKLITALTQRVDEQQSLLSKLQSILAMSATSRALMVRMFNCHCNRQSLQESDS
jgi:uncharacterized coiled-coil protein SlyX